MELALALLHRTETDAFQTAERRFRDGFFASVIFLKKDLVPPAKLPKVRGPLRKSGSVRKKMREDDFTSQLW